MWEIFNHMLVTLLYTHTRVKKKKVASSVIQIHSLGPCGCYRFSCDLLNDMLGHTLVNHCLKKH